MQRGLHRFSLRALALALVAGAVAVVMATPHASAQTPVPGTPNDGTPCAPVDEKALQAPYVFKFGLTGTELQQQFYGDSTKPNDGSYNDQGYSPVRTTGYTSGSDIYFATKWAKTGGPSWASRFGLTAADFNARYNLYNNTHMLIDFSAYSTPAGVRFIDTWRQAKPGEGFAVYYDQTLAQVEAMIAAMPGMGYIPLRVEGYTTAGQTRYATLWTKGNCQTFFDPQMTGAEFQAQVLALQNSMRLVHHDSYTVGSQDVSYAGIWWKQPDPGQAVRHGYHWYGFQRQFNNLACTGFVLDNFYAGESPGWSHYGGIWTYLAPPNVTPNSSLSARLGKHVNCAKGRAGAAVMNLTTGETIMHHADQLGGWSSSPKAAIYYTLLRKADKEKIDLAATKLNVSAQYGSNGGNLLTANSSYSLQYLAQIMIDNSHNWATNRLIDYVGMGTINNEMAALGLASFKLQRYVTGTGAPSAHGLADPSADYSAGYDNVASPRDMATFYKLVYQNAGLLSAKRHEAFFDTLGATTKGYTNAYLGTGVSAAWQNVVTIFNKAGSNDWNGALGTFQHKPQLADHDQASEAGLLRLKDGQIIVYAMFIDEADPESGGAPIGCLGYEVVRQYSGVSTGVVPAQCW